MNKTTRLRTMLESPHLEFIMEAHNGLSARIVEEAGFKGIWASGLAMSASLGIRDNNEASWSQVLEITEFMCDATSIPILVDADTGFGNFNNARRLARKLEQRGIAGMCIEDKLFPKTNSFINGDDQSLASIAEFTGKIRAVKDTQRDADFCVVARTEALIVGSTLDDALERGYAYREAGADAILIHSKHSTADEVLAFMERWDGGCPVVIVPTRYGNTPTDVFEKAGFSLVIWANHLMRSCITAMQQTAATVQRERSIARVEPIVAPLGEVFRLQDADELARAELRYLPAVASGGEVRGNGEISGAGANGQAPSRTLGRLAPLKDPAPKAIARNGASGATVASG
jgi:phosphoenolpyruvate phosphomutase